MIKYVEATMHPSSMRRLANAILRLADAIDQEWSPNFVKPNFPMFSKAAIIEKNAIPLSFSAVKEDFRSKIPEDILGSEIGGLPAWNILLELFKQFSGGAKVSTKTLQIISRCPEAAALRIINRLEELGFVARTPSHQGKRITFVSLTREGVVAVGSVLERFGD